MRDYADVCFNALALGVACRLCSLGPFTFRAR